MSENFTVIVSTRLTKSSVDELDRVRGRWTRADAVRELTMAAMRMRHDYIYSHGGLCLMCGTEADSIIHLTFLEQDMQSIRALELHEAARVDSHAEG